ncbi:MAG: hypothetical protein JW793_10045 [Acidobacteria bacterium]|nr:hypothetical protein [Acidobacteriota bacterium]
MGYRTGFEYDIYSGDPARIAAILRRDLEALFPGMTDSDYIKTHIKR